MTEQVLAWVSAVAFVIGAFMAIACVMGLDPEDPTSLRNEMLVSRSIHWTSVCVAALVVLVLMFAT